MTATEDCHAAVTVVVPCYCSSMTIERAVESVANQTLLPKQLILLDDCSPDDGATLQKLSRLKDRYAGHFVISLIELPRNIGVADARNAGWDLATQPYVALLDADDAWHPKKIEIQLAYMLADKSIDISGHDRRILRNGDGLHWRLDTKAVAQLTKRQLLISNPFITSSVIVKSNLPYRFQRGRRHMEDHLLWQEIICAGGKIAKLRTDLAAIFKQPYGVAGLSSNLWAMELGEIRNFLVLLRQGHISRLACYTLVVLSALKFCRRLLNVYSK